MNFSKSRVMIWIIASVFYAYPYVLRVTIGLVGAIYGGGPNTSLALLYGTLAIPVALCLGSAGFVYLFIQEKKNEKMRKNWNRNCIEAKLYQTRLKKSHLGCVKAPGLRLSERGIVFPRYYPPLRQLK